MIKRKRLKDSIISICVLILLVALNSCAANDKSEEPGFEEERHFPSDMVDAPRESIPTPETQDLPYGSAENPTMFDFATLPEEDYPHGKWTVNRLNSKYGPYKKAEIGYITLYEIAYVNIEFERFSVYFYPHPAKKFSFYKEGLEENIYDLSESDKNIELFIHSLRIIDPDYGLPYGMKLGVSTKTQIISAYGEEPAYYWKEDTEVDWKEDRFKVDLIEYYYMFLDDRHEIVRNEYYANAYSMVGENGERAEDHLYIVEDDGRETYKFLDMVDENGESPENYIYLNVNGMITYIFDENEILSDVDVNWWFNEL